MAAMLAGVPVAVARLKPPAEPSVTVKPRSRPVASVSRDAGRLMMSWLLPVGPKVWLLLPATRLAVAPVLRPTLLANRVAVAPGAEPAGLRIGELPEAKNAVPIVSLAAAASLPRKLSVPPAKATTAVSLIRLGLLTAVLSRVSVPPPPIVNPGPPGDVTAMEPAWVPGEAAPSPE